MRIWPLVTEFSLSAEAKENNSPKPKDVYMFTAQFIGYSMLIDIVHLVVGFLAAFKLHIKLLLVTFFVNLFSLGFSIQLVHPTENDLLTILIFSPLVTLQLFSLISVCVLLYSLKHYEYHRMHTENSRRATLSSVTQSLSRPLNVQGLKRAVSLPLICSNDDSRPKHRNYQTLLQLDQATSRIN